ncbi:unnamed protein product [Porites evermanni]|uniref:G-protein coupled receptors family 1 profile domain-containing protein n=1 Tax=Porites evermanni TaxID=104178 RepID=A0ABN8SDA7_9CNID|nr:unnamed protein product [Porites evermanni]
MVVSSSECTIWFTVFTAEFVAIVTVNLLSIILFIKNRGLRTRSMYLVISLTVADMLVGGLSGSVSQLDLLRNCHFVNLTVYLKVIRVLRNTLLFFPFVSLTNIAAISLERFHATFFPFRHRLIKSWVYVVAIVVVWVFPIILSVIWQMDWFLIKHHLYLWESHCCLCLIVTFVSYTSILLKFRFGAHPQRHCAAALRQRKLTVTLFITTLVSLLLWLPYGIYLFAAWLTGICNYRIAYPKGATLSYLMPFLFYTNSLVNPILYAIRMPDFKKALLSFFRCHRRENVATALNRY